MNFTLVIGPDGVTVFGEDGTLVEGAAKIATLVDTLNKAGIKAALDGEIESHRAGGATAYDEAHVAAHAAAHAAGHAHSH